MKKLLALMLALMLLPLAGLAEEVRLPGGLCWGMDEYQVEGAFGRAPDEKNQGVLGFDGEGRRILFSYRAYYGAKLLDRTVKMECILCRGGLVMLQITGQPEQLPEAELREVLTATCGPSQPIAGEEIVRRMTALMGGVSLGLMPGDGECWQLSPDTQLWFVAPGGVAGLILANVDAGGAAVATPEPPAWPQVERGAGDTLAAGDLPADLMPHGLTMGASYEQVFGALRGSQMGSDRLESLGLVSVYNDVIFGDAVGSQYLLVDDELRLITAVWLEEQPGEGHDRLVSKLTQRLGEPRQRSAEKMRAIAEARVGEGFTPTTDGLCWQIAPDTELWVIREAGTVGLVWVSVPPAEQFGGVRLGMDEWLLREGITPAMTPDAVRAAAGYDGQEVALGDTLFAVYPQSTLQGVAVEAAYMFEQGALTVVNYTVSPLEGGASPLEAARVALTDRLGEGRTMPMTDMARIMYGAEADLRGLPEVEGLAWRLPGESWLFLYEAEDLVFAVICPAAQ